MATLASFFIRRRSHPEQQSKKNLWPLAGFIAALLALSSGAPAQAWGGKVNLTRKYRPGQTMVYQSTIQTRATVQSDPPGLKSLLPPLPTELSTHQQNTVTVRAVLPEGTTNVETRFDEFEFQSNLSDQMPESARNSIKQAQQDFSRKVAGQILTAHYNRDGKLMGFEGCEAILEQLEIPLREPLRQILRLFLDQMGGHTLYPDHRVRPGEEWKRTLAGQPSDEYPFVTEGESTLRYVGKTKYRGVKAAIIDYHFSSAQKPELESLRRIGPLGQLEAMGVGLDLGIDGQGQGRVLLALDDGRVLQHRSTIRQKLTARLKGSPQMSLPDSGPLTIEIDAETTLAVDGSGRR